MIFRSRTLPSFLDLAREYCDEEKVNARWKNCWHRRKRSGKYGNQRWSYTLIIAHFPTNDLQDWRIPSYRFPISHHQPFFNFFWLLLRHESEQTSDDTRWICSYFRPNNLQTPPVNFQPCCAISYCLQTDQQAGEQSRAHRNLRCPRRRERAGRRNKWNWMCLPMKCSFRYYAASLCRYRLGRKWWYRHLWRWAFHKFKICGDVWPAWRLVQSDVNAWSLLKCCIYKRDQRSRQALRCERLFQKGRHIMASGYVIYGSRLPWWSMPPD